MIRTDRLLIAATILVVCALVAWGITIGGYPANANVFPAIAAAGVVLFGALALREEAPGKDDHAITLTAMLSVVAVLPLIYLLGFRLALPVYGFMYALSRRAGPLASVALALAVAAVVELLFVRVLGLSFHRGWLIAVLTR